MKYIRDNDVLSDGQTLLANEREQKGWGELLTCLESCQSGKRLRFASGFHGQHTWYEPSIDEGSVSALYGAKATTAPEGAVVLDTPTNTTTTTIVRNIDT
jgi:hypothetical protein